MIVVLNVSGHVCVSYPLWLVPYSRLISRGEIFVDWILKTFDGYIFKDYN